MDAALMAGHWMRGTIGTGGGGENLWGFSLRDRTVRVLFTLTPVLLRFWDETTAK